jgi:hypothetical protein
MATQQMTECGRCGRTLYPESEETHYCGECSSHFCIECECTCEDNQTVGSI